MSFFNPQVPLKEKVISHHPWERNIKDIYSSTYKYGHNSARNPVYPRKKEKRPNAKRVRFTIIGNRVIKDFILSVNLVKGLHKYRWKSFDAPVIRGVTSVEWPQVWNDLKLQYGGLAYCIKSQLAVLINDKFLGGFTELKELIESRYIYHLTFDYYKEGVKQFASYIRSSGRPCAYMHISINGDHIGTFIFMLYADIVPLTCENFLRLCKTKKGGYSGTPVHRIVKDCWIQCGGFGLKNTSLDCENFIVPHDQRGLLCMANDGRYVDCSTQFFVLLQPAPWMAHKYVAFGQLIDGEETLKQIESVPTWYESPTPPIIIFDAGIFNMDCHGITINKETNAYIQGHIEDLFALGELLYEAVLENVFLELEVRSVERLHGQGEEEMLGEGEQSEGMQNIRATKRFMRKKEDIEQQLEKSEKDYHSTSGDSQKNENKEFDVDVYEPEEYQYHHTTPAASESIVVKPEKPFYLPLTDVPYPGEVNSSYDLKKFLKGDYCLESDLEKDITKKGIAKDTIPSEIFDMEEEEEEEESDDFDSDDENEIKKYLKNNVDRVSFAGGIITHIARQALAKHNIFEGSRKSELITDEQLRRLRLASVDYRHQRDKKVSISVAGADKAAHHQKIKRRQTGFVRPEDLEKIHVFSKRHSELTGYVDDDDDDDDDDDQDDKKVRISESTAEPTKPKPSRRPTAFVRAPEVDPDEEPTRPSVLARLYDEVNYDDDAGPTLKDYKPLAETHTKNLLFLTSSPQSKMKSAENERESYYRHSITMENNSLDNLLNLQHGKKVARKISSDYVKTIDQIEHKLENSIRSIEYAKTRPTISVSEYQLKNQKYQQDQLKEAACKLELVSEDTELNNKKSLGLRLPGDTPLYSLASSPD